MIAELARLPSGSRVSRADIIESLAERVRGIDPAVEFRHGFKRLDNTLLRKGEMPELDRLLGMMPRRFRDPFDWLRVDGRTLAVPVGYETLAMFAMLFSFDSGPVVFQTADVRIYNGTSATIAWTKPSLPKRWAGITLIGGGGSGAGGGRTTTSGNDAAGGGGGGGGSSGSRQCRQLPDQSVGPEQRQHIHRCWGVGRRRGDGGRSDWRQRE